MTDVLDRRAVLLARLKPLAAEDRRKSRARKKKWAQNVAKVNAVVKSSTNLVCEYQHDQSGDYCGALAIAFLPDRAYWTKNRGYLDWPARARWEEAARMLGGKYWCQAHDPRKRVCPYL